ncbi:PilZ domain-containing protein [Endothiovibrio diazotrophicus]
MNARRQLIHDHRPFLQAYRPRFQAVFLKVSRVLAPGRGDAQVLEAVALDYYDHYFLDDGEGGAAAAEAALRGLAGPGIEAAPILAKCFAVMTAEFVARAVKAGEVVEPVHALTGVLREALAVLEPPAEHHACDAGAVVRLALEQLGGEFTLRHRRRGVEVSERAILRRGDAVRGTLELMLSAGQRLAIDEGEPLDLHNPALPRPLRGQVELFDEGEGLLVLGGIVEADHVPRPRNGVRVQPPTPVAVTLSARDGRRDGRLLDLSVGGLSVATGEALAWARGSWVHVRFELPMAGRRGAEAIDARAEIVGGGLVGQAWRYGLRLMPNLHQEQVIGEYVNHLQSEVIRHIEPVLHHPAPAPPRRRPLPRAVSGLIAAAVVLIFAGLFYYAASQRRGNPTGIDRVAELLSIQEACDDLAERHAISGNPADLSRFDACRRRLEEARRNTNWQR